jgi:hypothetical protein
MGAGYKVILGDLDAAAGAFTTESADFGKLRSRMSPAPVDGGDATVNAGIEAVLALFAAGNAALVKAMHEHGDKLKTCHDNYKEDDSDVVALYNKLSETT